MCVVTLFTTFPGTFLIRRRIQRDATYLNGSSCKVPYRYPYQIFIDLEFSRQIFEKFSNFKSHANPSIRNRVIVVRQTDGQTNRQTDGND